MGLEPVKFFQNCSSTYKWNSWHTVEKHRGDRRTVKLCWKTENKRARESIWLGLSGTSDLNGSPAISLSAFSDSQWNTHTHARARLHTHTYTYTHTHTHTHSYTFWGRGGKNDIEMKGKKGRERSEDLGVMAVLLVILVFLSPLLRWQFITCLIMWMCLWFVHFCWHVCLWQIRKSAIKSFPGSASCFPRERDREREREREGKIQR